MFSNGQILFAVLFTLVFSIFIVQSYKKDKKLHSKNYKGVQWVGIIFLVFLLVLFCIKHFLKD